VGPAWEDVAVSDHADQHYSEVLREVACDLQVPAEDLLQSLRNRDVIMTRSSRVRDSPSLPEPLQHGINGNHAQQDTQHSSSNCNSGWLDTLPEAGQHSGSLLNSIQNSPSLSAMNPQNLNIQLELAPSITLDFISPRNESNLVQQGIGSHFSLGAIGLESRREVKVTHESYGGGFEGNSFISDPEAAFQKGMNYLRSSQGQIDSTNIYSIEPTTSDMRTENRRDHGLDEEQHPMGLHSSQLGYVPTTPLDHSQRDSSTLSMSWTTLTPSTDSDQSSRSNTSSITVETAASKFAAAVSFGPCSKTWELPPRVSILQRLLLLLYLLTLREEAAAQKEELSAKCKS
jgi:hypothetical protein